MMRPSFNVEDNLRRYVSAYPDLALRLSRAGSPEGLRRHMEFLREQESREVPNLSVPPQDWSDTLFSAAAEPHARELWRLGVLDTLFYHAQVERPEDFLEHGQVGMSTALSTETHFQLKALAQAADFEMNNLAGGPLANLRAARFDWTGHAQPVNSLFRTVVRRLDLKAHLYNIVILVPCLESGGAELVAFWHYRAAKSLGLRPVLVLTDKPIVTKRFSSVEVINIPEIIEKELGLSSHNLAIEQRMLCLAQVLRAVDPAIVHLIHSWAGYNLFGSRMFRRLFNGSQRLLVSAFCPHVHQNGQVEGYFRHIPGIDDATAGYVCDNQWYANEISALSGLAPSRVHSLRYPVEPSETSPPPVDRALKVLWASRLDFQKNPAIVFAIAKELPDYQFDVWGRVVMSDEEIDWGVAPVNVAYCGEFFSVDEIPINDYGVFLYTSKFDGMPNILLEMARAGLPIVSSWVGGIGEFIHRDVGRLIDEPTDVSGFVAALRELLSDDALRLRMSQAIIAKVRGERSLDAFVAEVASLPEYMSLLAIVHAAPLADLNQAEIPCLVP